MTFNFTVKEFILGNGTPTLQFYRRGFNLVGGGESPSWRDVILSGNTALTLVNAKEDGLNYLKLFGGTEQLPETYLDTVTLSGGCEQRNLPSEFTQVEYIQSDGTAWLDTGFIANGGMIFDGKVMPIDMDNLTVGSLTDIGTPGQANLTRNLISYANGNGYTPQKLDNYQTIYADAGTSPAIIHLDTTGTKFYCTINGNVVVDTTTNVLTNQTTTVKIGFSDYSQLIRKGRYYPLQFRNSNGDLVRDLVPAKNSSNVVSMYDKVTDTFMTVQGTGSFTAGADVTAPSPDRPIDIVCNNGVLKVNRNLYSTEYHDEVLSQTNGVTTSSNAGVNVSAMVDCRTIKSFKITTASPQGSFRIFKYGTDNTFINATSTANIGDIVTVEDNVGFFRIQYNYTSFSTNTENILIYNSAYDLKEVYADGTQEVVTDSLGNTASAEMLLAVSNYKDTQEVLSGSVSRSIGIKVLDGTENWYTWSTLGYYCDFINAGAKTGQKVLCTISTSWNFTSVNRLLCSISQSTFPTLEDWKQYLADQYQAGTPIIMVYALASSTSESTTGQFLSKSPVTQTAGAISNLGIAETSSSHTVPTPTQPLQINCNNGVVKVRHQSGLPWGYTLLDYIESTGTQYINTGYLPNANTAISIKYYPAITSSFMCLYGTQDTTNANRFYGLISSTQFRVQVNSNAGQTPNFWGINNDGTLIDNINGTFAQTQGIVTLGVDNKNKVISVKSDEYTGNISASGTVLGDNLNCQYYLLLLTRGTAGVAANNFSGRLYSFTIKDNDVLVQNLIPARRNSDNVIGMYDLVSQTFFTNAGTGDFTAGNTVSDPVAIYTDGTTETVQVYSKNLLDVDWEQGAINGTSMRTYEQNKTDNLTRIRIANEFYVDPTKTYTISINDNNLEYVFQVYDSNHLQTTITGSNTWGDTAKTFTGVYGIAIAVRYKNQANIDPSVGATAKMQLELGSTATTYEPYFNGGTATAENLFKVGTYQDVQSVLDGSVTRKVSVRVLEGTDTDLVYYGVYFGHNLFYLDLRPDEYWIDRMDVMPVCSHYNGYAGSANNMPDQSIRFQNRRAGAEININRIYLTDDRFDNLSDLATWLTDQYNAGTPVILVYPLATATTETVTAQPLNIKAGTNIVEITQASMDSLPLEVSYKAGVAVTITEIQNAQLDNNVEVTING